MNTGSQACVDDWVEVASEDLPLACPMVHQSAVHAHPRVYLPIENTGKAKCYYCGTLYVLSDYSGASDEADA